MTDPHERRTFADFQQEDDRGLVCPECGCRHFDVLETVPAPAGKIRRRRQCRNCGWRTTTVEMRLIDAAKSDTEPVPARLAKSDHKRKKRKKRRRDPTGGVSLRSEGKSP